MTAHSQASMTSRRHAKADANPAADNGRMQAAQGPPDAPSHPAKSGEHRLRRRPGRADDWKTRVRAANQQEWAIRTTPNDNTNTVRSYTINATTGALTQGLSTSPGDHS